MPVVLTFFKEVHFEKLIDFRDAHFKGSADFTRAHFEGMTTFETTQFKGNANFWGAQFKGDARFGKAQFNGDANFGGARFKGDADFSVAHFFKDRWADFLEVQFEGKTSFAGTRFEGKTSFRNANLQNTNFKASYLNGVGLQYAIVSGNTLINDDCSIDRKTDFTGVGLNSARVGPKIKQLLKYNVRRLGWEEKYKKSRLMTLPWRFFWWISDYGMATGWIVGVFFAFAFLFSLIYFVAGLIDYSQNTVTNPGIINNLFIIDPSHNGQWQPFVMSGANIFTVFVRSLYFSVVTMTTLGFGDMHARPDSIVGPICLICQVLLGYVLLGALITRLTILFTQDGPPVRFPGEVGLIKKIRQGISEDWKIIVSDKPVTSEESDKEWQLFLIQKALIREQKFSAKLKKMQRDYKEKAEA